MGPELAGCVARSRRSVPKMVCIAISPLGFCPRARITGRARRIASHSWGRMGVTTMLSVFFTCTPDILEAFFAYDFFQSPWCTEVALQRVAQCLFTVAVVAAR